MKKLFQVISILLISLTLVHCATNSKVASNEKGKRNPASHTWNNYHWARSANPFTLQVGNNLTTTTWKNHLASAVTDWNSPELFSATSSPIVLSVVPGKSARKCSMVAGTTQVCNDKYGRNGWLGLASINIINGTHITQGTAKVNDSYFEMVKYNNPNERQHVMCQEIAHTFGLDHQSENGSSQDSCMDYFSNTGVNATSTLSTRPNLHDFEMLNALYDHIDNLTTVAASPALARTQSDVRDEDPQSWGRFVSEMSRGRHGYYEKANKDGSITLTHVYWTIEAAARGCQDCDHRGH